MTFGYLGYIWAILCCGLFSTVFLGAAAVLYGTARRRRRAGDEPVHTVEALPQRPQDPPPPDGAA